MIHFRTPRLSFFTATLILNVCLPGQLFASEPFTLALPVKCELGATCFVQNYVDHDPSEKVSDFQCGGRTYNGHDGTDIRLPDLEVQKNGVEVLAAATGRIMQVRDGMDDVSIRVAGKNSIAGKECGNGVVMDRAGLEHAILSHGQGKPAG
jgi:hypothetical protein